MTNKCLSKASLNIIQIRELLSYLRSWNIQDYIYQAYKYLHTYRVVFFSTLARQEKAKMRLLYVFLLFLYILSRIGILLFICNHFYQEYLQEPKQCSAEIHDRLYNELTKTRETLRILEGKIEIKYFKCVLQQG